MTVNTRSYSVAWIALGLILGAMALPARAGVILQDTANRLLMIQFYEAIGQSFTAEDSHVKVALYYTPLNTGSPNADSIRINLYEGDGTGGTVLGTDLFFLANGFDGYRDSDFSSLTLTVGQTYTFAALIEGDDEYWSVMGHTGDPYAGGRGWTPRDEPASFPQPATDLRFRVTPVVAAAAPEPAMAALLGIGLAGMIFVRRPLVTRRNKEQ